MERECHRTTYSYSAPGSAKRRTVISPADTVCRVPVAVYNKESKRQRALVAKWTGLPENWHLKASSHVPQGIVVVASSPFLKWTLWPGPWRPITRIVE